ncbi:hypothetical protein CCP2SC5_130052 [Azospirillaceae bacterium]
MFLVVGDHKGGAKAPLIREAIFFWNLLFVGVVFPMRTMMRPCKANPIRLFLPRHDNF